jgi:N-acetylglucosamine-6-phosphate deacetylase
MLNTYALVGAKIFDGENFLESHNIIIENETIKDIVKYIPEDIKIYDFSGCTITPGFIDLQINGCGGVLLNDDISEKTLSIMAKTCAKYGVTSFLPTLITTTEDNIKKAIAVLSVFHEKQPHQVIGIHIEGPYISKVKKGAHNAQYIKPIDQNMVSYLSEAVKKLPIKITMAPEENDINLIKQLIDAGVRVSIGHSNANYDQAQKSIDIGVSLGTHLFNAMSSFEGRSPGVVGAILNNDSLYSGVIVDGHHVDFKSIEIVKKIKKDRIYVVTDAVTPMGTEMEEFYLADQLVRVKNGACINENGNLAGANIDMLSSFKNLVFELQFSEKEAFKMISSIPAKAFGVDNKLGYIKAGFIANLVILDSNFNIKHVLQNGEKPN